MQRDQLRIVLVRPRDPNNIGAAARAMKNFGRRELRLVAPHPPVWDEARSGVGATDVLTSARVFETLSEAVADCALVVGTADPSRARGTQPRITPARLGAQIESCGGPSALVFGPEKTGLTNADLSHCDFLLSIPTVDQCPSMNLAAAVAICCYELRESSAGSATSETETATAGAIEALLEEIVETLARADYFAAGGREARRREIRAMLRRWRLTPREVALWRGALRRIKRGSGQSMTKR